MEIEGVTFPEAVEILARPLDIDLSAWLRDDESEGERRAFHRANEVAMNLWRDAFWDPKLGRQAPWSTSGTGFQRQGAAGFRRGLGPGRVGLAGRRPGKGGRGSRTWPGRRI